MNVEIIDGKALKAVPVKNLFSYLENKGWVKRDTDFEAFSIWHNKPPRGKLAEILAPGRNDYLDYAARVQECIKAFAFVEDRSQLFIYKDLMGDAYVPLGI